MDNETLTVAFKAHAEGQTNFTRRMAITLADMADMRPMSLVWRLEKMGLLKRGSWEWFKMNGGITADQVHEVRLDRTRGDRHMTPPVAEQIAGMKESGR